MTSDMLMVQALAIVASSSLGMGLRTYLIPFLVGLMGHYHYLTLPSDLAMLSNMNVIYGLGALTVLEFFADKIPFIDSLWTFVHSFLRLPFASFFAFAMMHQYGMPIAVASVFLGLGLSTGTLTTKSGVRILANHSPEPVSNITLSVAEDGLIGFLIWLATAYPVASLIVCGIIFVFMIWVGISMWKRWQRKQSAKNLLPTP